ncbi:MAG: pyridoxal-phosphate dependent enzyme, partial [Myxococcota bacterium]|nr:pyridoxal-phosphate dependent enzyme [Myxococcota bacterium]
MPVFPRIPLVQRPTPIVKRQRLDELLSVDLWVKRDDMTGGAEAGNKVRKLEFLLGDAMASGCDTVITCGGLQSNHARATALACASLGLACVLVLRADDPSQKDLPRTGNLFLDRLAGAELRLVSHEDYAKRAFVMDGIA